MTTHPAEPRGTQPGVPRVADSSTIRVLIVDDYAIYRRGVEAVLSLEPDIEIVGEVDTQAEAVAAVADLAPDVVLLDIYLQDGNGIAACSEMKDAAPGARILMLTASDEDADLVAAIKAGATGYLLKDVGPDQLPAAVRAVAAGQALLSPSLASTLLSEFSSMLRERNEPNRAAGPELTDRELQVLKLVARGLSNKAVAEELFISENTVKNHVRNILEKLHLRSRRDAALYAVRSRLIEDPGAMHKKP